MTDDNHFLFDAFPPAEQLEINEDIPETASQTDHVACQSDDTRLPSRTQFSTDESEQTIEQLEHTLDYFVFTSGRISEMARTYSSDALSALLQEREKDLQLAAKIGQSLLERNASLQEEREVLEEKLFQANERIAQLNHELQLKVELLNFFTNDGGETASGMSSSSGTRFQLELLKSKVGELEADNLKLRNEAANLRDMTSDLEEKEQDLVSDYLKQLGAANQQMVTLENDLSFKEEECFVNQSEVTNLLSQLVETQTTVKKLTYEREELHSKISTGEGLYFELHQEMDELKRRYGEVVGMLSEAQDESKRLRDQVDELQNAQDSVYDSLQSELEASDSGFARSIITTRTPSLKVTQNISNDNIVPSNNVTVTSSEPSSKSQSHLQVPLDSSDKFLVLPQRSSSAESLCSSVANGIGGGESRRGRRGPRPLDRFVLAHRYLELRKPSLESEDLHVDHPSVPAVSFNFALFSSFPGSDVGVPGVPGSKDLEKVIKNFCSKRNLLKKYSAILGSPDGCRLLRSNSPCPPIITSTPCKETGNAKFVPYTVDLCCAKGNELQLIKPIEGSSLLKRWRELATPSITRSLDCVFLQLPTEALPSKSNIETEFKTTSVLPLRVEKSCPNAAECSVLVTRPCTSQQIESQCSGCQSVGVATLTFVSSSTAHLCPFSAIDGGQAKNVGCPSCSPFSSHYTNEASKNPCALNFSESHHERCTEDRKVESLSSLNLEAKAGAVSYHSETSSAPALDRDTCIDDEFKNERVTIRAGSKVAPNRKDSGLEALCFIDHSEQQESEKNTVILRAGIADNK